jgi:hypothetical protein
MQLVKDNVETIRSVNRLVVILQPFHLSTTAPATAPDDNDDDTIAISQLVLYQDNYVLPSDNRYGYSTTPTNGELILDKYVLPSYNRYGYSTTPTDGELILLFRLVYRVDRRHHNNATAPATAPATATIATATTDTATTTTTTTTIDGELILLFRLHRVDILYRVNAILSSIILLLLQSGSVHNDDDDDVDIIQLVVNYAQNNYSYGMNEAYANNGRYKLFEYYYRWGVDIIAITIASGRYNTSSRHNTVNNSFTTEQSS